MLLAMVHYCRTKSMTCSSIILIVFEGFSNANASIIVCHAGINLWYTKTTNFKENKEHDLDFLSKSDVIFLVLAHILFSILMPVELFACQTHRPGSHNKAWCVPRMWDQNWCDPACLKWHVHSTVFVENSALLERALSFQIINKNWTNELLRNVQITCNLL